jgi:cysteine desulfurase
MRSVYLDNNSATRIDDRVLDAMLPFLKDEYGNAQSMHSPGQRAKDALEGARAQVAELIGSRPDEVYFTSCGSESNNLALKGIAKAYRQKGRHIIISAIEHVSILQAAKKLGQQGWDITILPVDGSGRISLQALGSAIRNDTVLVSIQHANPEIGTVQPLPEISRIVHGKGALFHTDAVCTAGVIATNVNDLGADLLSLASSTMYGPKGAAALYVKKGVKIAPQVDGGVQEAGRRAGTENIPAIVGFGKACRIASAEMESNRKRIQPLRDRLINELPQKIEYIFLNGHPHERAPNNVNFSVEFVEGEGMLLFLDERGISVTSGSACTSRTLKMSHVLQATGMDAAVAQGSVLMTLSKHNTADDVDYILAEFPPIVKRLRDMSPLYAHFLKTGKRMEAGPGTDYEHHDEHGAEDV